MSGGALALMPPPLHTEYLRNGRSYMTASIWPVKWLIRGADASIATLH